MPENPVRVAGIGSQAPEFRDSGRFPTAWSGSRSRGREEGFPGDGKDKRLKGNGNPSIAIGYPGGKPRGSPLPDAGRDAATCCGRSGRWCCPSG